jgi:small-conductance mechanosensitive channel
VPQDEDLTQATNVLVTILAVVGAMIFAFVLGTIISLVVRRVGRKSWFVGDVSRRMRHPLRAVLMVVSVWIVIRAVTADDIGWLPAVEHIMLIVCIIVSSWFIGALAFVIEDSVLKRFRMDVADNRHARRVRTQITVVRRVTVSLIAVCAIAAVLLTFPAARAAGASLLASAGVVSIVAGLAAQTSLANVFAGMQIAFTDAIRVDDVVVLEGEWGRIEEITMTYVVVHLWDDRRLIMPCTYFTTTPFQNWTRRAAELLGTVEIDLDWEVPLAPMRAELKRLLEATPLWDHRVGILQVTDATRGYVRVRALASAADAGTLFDLRCYVREGLVEWLHRMAPQGMPHTRITTGRGSLDECEAPLEHRPPATATAAVDDDATAVFSEPFLPGDSARVRAPGAARQSIPQRIPVREARPGLRMRMSEPTRGVHLNQPHPDRAKAEPTVVIPGGAASETTAILGGAADQAVWDTGEGLFTGSAQARERSKAFAGPGKDVIDERERTAHLERVPDEDSGLVRQIPAEDGASDGDSGDGP